jgi:3-oxoacyl-[acyl-carrier protein] reductase
MGAMGASGLLDGKVAIVTGGARGIGRAYCHGLAREGADVVVADLRMPTETVGELESTGADALGLEVDVGDRSSTEAMAAAALDRFGRVDVLVNNAAFYMAVTKSRFEDITVDEWDLCFAVNVRGPWLCARAVSPTMRAQGSGKIINIASMTVEDGTPNFLHYVSSKAAVIGMSRSMARELGDDGIAVNTITPDYIPHDKDYASEQWAGLNAWIEGDRCFKREQVPEDMVGTLLYLASPLSDFVSGQNIRVNGGRRFA